MEIVEKYYNKLLDTNAQEDEILYINKIKEFVVNDKVYVSLTQDVRAKLSIIKIDLTYSNTKGFTERSEHIFKSIEFIDSLTTQYSLLKGTFLIFKMIFNSYNLNNSWHGGVNSYCLLLLLAAYFKSSEGIGLKYSNYAEVTSKILKFYSYRYDFQMGCIDLNTSSVYLTNPNLGIYPIIIDPILKVNSSQNCYKILEIQASLKLITEKLGALEKKFEDQSENYRIKEDIKGLLLNLDN